MKSIRFETSTLPPTLPNSLLERRGVFVRVLSRPEQSGNQRGQTLACLGYPSSSGEIAQATQDAAVACAVQLSKSGKISTDSMQRLIFEVSVLTEPELLKVETPADYPKRIDARRDGLLVKYGFTSGVILPQVAVENDYDQNDLLCECCVKSGLPSSSWLTLSSMQVYRFQDEVYRENEPTSAIT